MNNDCEMPDMINFIHAMLCNHACIYIVGV